MQGDPMSDSTSTSSRLVLRVIGVLVVTAIAVAAVLSAVRSTPDLDPTTPEGVAQVFYRAILDGDDTAALLLMTPALRERCDGQHFRGFYYSDSVRVVLTGTDISSDEARVDVEIDRVSDPSPFDIEGYSSRERLTMTKTDGGWEIAEAPWPFRCPEGS